MFMTLDDVPKDILLRDYFMLPPSHRSPCPERSALISKIVMKIMECLVFIAEVRFMEDFPYMWEHQARDNQWEPEGAWHTWLIMAGRGFGKTRTGAETVRRWVHEGRAKRIALVGQTVKEVMSVMVQGDSGILAVHPESERPTLNRQRGCLEWPNGAIATFYGADYYDKLRGPQFDGAWVDELAKFRDPQAAWDQLMFCLRLGEDPRVVVTTTPRPVPLLRRLMDAPTTVVTRGSTLENAKNLAPSFVGHIMATYENTRLGVQEIYGELICDVEGALWKQDRIVYAQGPLPPLTRIVVGVDPALTGRDTSDETGIVVVGLGSDGRLYVLEDGSLRGSPTEWAAQVVKLYHAWKADRIVAEVNAGGDLVEQVIRTVDEMVSFRPVRATRGKVTRAEPVAALYEQGRVLHAHPFLTLEKQMCTFVAQPGAKSPDRMDALVWALTDLQAQAATRTLPRIWSI